MKIDKLELRKVRINNRMSDETVCFSADVIVNGRCVGEAMNHGHGGQTEIRVPGDVLAALNAHGEATLTDPERYIRYRDSGKLVDGGACQLIDALVEDFQRNKEADKLRKVDAKEVITNAKRGCGTMRWACKRGSETTYAWIPIKPGEDPAVLAQKATERYAKHGGEISFAVLT